MPCQHSGELSNMLLPLFAIQFKVSLCCLETYYYQDLLLWNFVEIIYTASTLWIFLSSVGFGILWFWFIVAGVFVLHKVIYFCFFFLSFFLITIHFLPSWETFKWRLILTKRKCRFWFNKELEQFKRIWLEYRWIVTSIKYKQHMRC